jgi:hypothetical protein
MRWLLDGIGSASEPLPFCHWPWQGPLNSVNDNSSHTIASELAKASAGSELLPAVEAVLRGERFDSRGIEDNKLTDTP